jgi:membrane-associated phospholipid phosphatase
VLRRSRPLLLGAGACLVALLVVRAVAFGTGAGRRGDTRVLEGFAGLDRPSIHSPASLVANLASPKPFVVLTLVLLGISLVRGRPRTAVAVGAALALANLTTQILKPALASPRAADLPPGHGVDAASWPSGHATASMALALALIVVVPPRLRPAAAAAGAAFTVAVSFSFLVLSWHFPSDVIGGYLVAGLWMTLALAALAEGERRWPTAAVRERGTSLVEALAPAGGLVALTALLALVVAASRPEAVTAYAREHTTFVLGAGVIGALGLGLAAGLALTLRRSPSRARN